MKISEALFRKYISGKCTDEEKRFVETWLNSEEDVPSTLTDTHILQMKERTWNKIEKTNWSSFQKADQAFERQNTMEKVGLKTSARPAKTISVFNSITRIAVAACFALFFFGAGFLSSASLNVNMLLNDIAFNKGPATAPKVLLRHTPVEENLYVSNFSGMRQKINAKNKDYHINFKGLIRLYSTSRSEQTLTCNGKELLLQPHREYFIMSSPSQGFYEFPNKIDIESYAYNGGASNFYEVCTRS